MGRLVVHTNAVVRVVQQAILGQRYRSEAGPGEPSTGLSIDVLREVGRGCPCLPEALDAECDHLEGPDVAILPTEGLAAWLAPAVLRGGPPERALLGPLLKPAQDGPPQVVVHGSALTHA